jgi:L-threonylcarbamoyladenylate synthase
MAEVSLAELTAAAQAGTHLVSFLTDTVPALACRPDAAALIYAAKQRSETKPLILMASTAADLWPYVMGSQAEMQIWQQVAECYWPGALTLVLPASPQLPKAMNPTDPTTIGLRVPDHAVARQILALTGPLATTSVNRSGEPALLTLADINAQFPEVLMLGPEVSPENEPGANPPPGSGQPSTVAKWNGQGWQILRQGQIRLPEA